MKSKHHIDTRGQEGNRCRERLCRKGYFKKWNEEHIKKAHTDLTKQNKKRGNINFLHILM